MVDGLDTTIPLLAQLIAWLCFLATCVGVARRLRSTGQAGSLVRNVLSGMTRRDGRSWLAHVWAPAAMQPVPVRAVNRAAGNRSRLGPESRAVRPPF